jgi:hypothetical protein
MEILIGWSNGLSSYQSLMWGISLVSNQAIPPQIQGLLTSKRCTSCSIGQQIPVLNPGTFGFITSMCGDKLGNSGSKSSNSLVSFVLALD